MKSVVRPELPTAAAGPSQAPAAAVDNSAPRSTHPEPTYKSGKAVQTTGTTSLKHRERRRVLNIKGGRFFSNRLRHNIKAQTTLGGSPRNRGCARLRQPCRQCIAS